MYMMSHKSNKSERINMLSMDGRMCCDGDELKAHDGVMREIWGLRIALRINFRLVKLIENDFRLLCATFASTHILEFTYSKSTPFSSLLEQLLALKLDSFLQFPFPLSPALLFRVLKS
jgi:hypothetical protein